ncbi:hypothetical protein BIV59_05685 [Bacillus sp. MUM 13]|nr:hypothetical protein BIV59_05685 [Bacillus sp. MUM 13]
MDVMDSEKRTYYVDLVGGDVLLESIKEENPSFVIEANDSEVNELKSYLEKNHTADMKTYVRSHIPYEEYHKDSQNGKYDRTIQNIYAMIYKLGNEQSRRFIEEMGILEDDNYQERKDMQRFKQ